MRIYVSAITRLSSGSVNETKNTIATLIMVSDWVLRLWCDKMESSPDNRLVHTGKEKLRNNKTEYLIYTVVHWKREISDIWFVFRVLEVLKQE
jgi:hypothetical protein